MHWIFGYGSLLWNPGFAHLGRHRAELRGYHRAYMMYSTRNRGSPDCPGMVLSLAPGASCVGMAFEPDPAHLPETLRYLDEREGVGRAHYRSVVPIVVQGENGPAVRPAITYLPILSYSNYIGGVPLSRRAELVAIGRGKTGSAYDYLRLLLEELVGLGVAEPELERLFREAQRLRSHLQPHEAPARPAPQASLPLLGK